ncbi:MAG TPA: DNA internalization-related competence protein ComEC/Rec2 [Dehalococcoidia bacterium]|nr:DNA internalization-related competence protein ComEC/Rec2 [Dehalococcoidia bacterium]
MILIAGGYVSGTVLAVLLGGPWWATAALSSLAAAATLARLPTAAIRPAAVVLVAVVAVTAAGHARFETVDGHPAPAFAALEGSHDVVGTVRRDPLPRGTTVRLDLDVTAVDGEATDGGLRLTVRAPQQPLRAGDRLSATVDVERPPELPQFDYAAYLSGRGIHAVAAFPERWSVIERDTGSVPVRALRDLREWLVGNLERALPEPEASLAAGMLLGERRTIPSGLNEDLRRTGTTHLVVVSGQNVALLLGTAIALLTAVISRRRASLLTLALLPGYLVLVGFDPPVVRAAIMAVGLSIAGVAGRRTPAWIYLLYAAAIMLAIDPLLARDVAFQLSMSATAGVMVLAPAIRDRLLTVAGWSADGMRSTLVEALSLATGAALAVLPVQVATFDTFSLLTVPANVIAAPIYEGTIVVALLAALFGWFDPVADVVRSGGSFVPAMFVETVDLLARLPGTEIPARAPLAVGAGWYALLAAAVWALRRGETPVLSPRARSGYATTVALAAVAGGLWIAVLTPAATDARVTILDVGQGLAVLVRDGNTTVLIDSGPPDGNVVQALSRAGVVNAIDAVVITHSDADHRGGLPAIERRYDVGRAVGDTTVVAERLDIGDSIRLSARTSIEVLSPPVVTAGRAHVSDNNGSLVLLITIGERRLLLPADIEKPAERWLITSGLDIRADALVVPHHGSASSSTRDFIDAVQPIVAVVSAGTNPYGHPHEDVLRRYTASGITLRRTDIDGDVTLSSDGTRLWVSSGR